MKFDILHSDTNCNCIEGTHSDFKSRFARRIMGKTIVEKDIATHWEKGIGRGKTDCREICEHKALSINLFSPEYESLIIKKYNDTFRFNPKIGNYLVKFKIKFGAGVVKPKPTKNDISHYNFFKSDDFELSNLEIIETKRIDQNV